MNWSLLRPSTWNPLISFFNLFISQEKWISTQALSDFFIHLIISVALFFFICSLISTIKSIYKINKYLNVLKERDAIAKTKSSDLPLFKTFRRHLLTLSHRDDTGQTSLYRTVDAAEIFHESVLAPGLTTNRLFLAMPGILTRFGCCQ
jgi:hypothetical protein